MPAVKVRALRVTARRQLQAAAPDNRTPAASTQSNLSSCACGQTRGVVQWLLFGALCCMGPCERRVQLSRPALGLPRPYGSSQQKLHR